MLIANLLPCSQRIVISGFPIVDQAPIAIRRLNEDTARAAMFEPNRFREQASYWSRVSRSRQELEVALRPYETATLDLGG